MKCSLCGSSDTKVFYTTKKKTYHQCLLCKSILLDPSLFLLPEKEKKRYLLHNNDESDPGYKKFVFPIIEEVLKTHKTSHKGLDYGSGPTPIIQIMLEKKGFSISNYDPFFAQNKKVLSQSYHYIVCCEVMEHFHHPADEFALLHKLLQPKGTLYCKTLLYDTSIDFENWWYKNDPTHVFFYTKDTLLWIQEHYGFSKLKIKNDLFIYTK